MYLSKHRVAITFLGISAFTAWTGDVQKSLKYSLILLGSVLVVVPLYRLSQLHPLHRFPGSKWNKITELAMLCYTVLGIRHKKLRSLHDRYGRVVQTGPNTLSFVSASAISSIHGSAHAPDKASAYEMQHLKGDGLFFLKDKASHNRRRRIWNRSFSEEAILGYQSALVGEIEHLFNCLLEKTSHKGKVDLVRLLPQYAYDSMNAVFFSGHAFNSLLDSDDPAGIAPQGTAFFRLSEIFTHIQPLFHFLMLIPGIGSLMDFEKLSIRAAEAWFKKGPTFRDGISYWFEGDEFQPKLPPEDLAIESETILLGGADTLGSTTTMLCYFLLTHPQWIPILREQLELHNVFDETGHPDAHLLNNLDSIPLIEAFVQETLRLGTLLPGLPRVVPKGGMTIDGYDVPGGTIVTVPVWSYHVDAEYFPNPRKFDPERWIEEGKFVVQAPLMAFSVGTFNCVGSKLALTQLRILLAMAVQKLDITLVEGFDAEKFWNGIRNTRTHDFVEPMWVRVAKRNSPA
ncbi:cytochrome P450 [Favolaschia claudopus]|uniref:Cytochrome P450 n=1 Tax=Favolaschia claudopus TaxID=2862362 RepID=A0AAW0AX78_9AGAR